MLTSMGRYAEALDMGQQAQRIKDASADTPPRERAVGLVNIASALDGLRRFDEAAAVYADALRQFEAMSPPPQFDISIALDNLAYLQGEMGHLDQAVVSQQRSIALHRKVMGPDYPRLVVSLSNLAQQYAKLGRHDEAAEGMRDALRLAPQAYSKDDQMLGHLYTAAANIALARGDATETQAQAKLALDVYDHTQAVEPGRREKGQAVLDASRGLKSALANVAPRK
ncbi:MAG: tetratricopeptide repeat protein [Dokdonella sp.]